MSPIFAAAQCSCNVCRAQGRDVAEIKGERDAPHARQEDGGADPNALEVKEESDADEGAGDDAGHHVLEFLKNVDDVGIGCDVWTVVGMNLFCNVEVKPVAVAPRISPGTVSAGMPARQLPHRSAYNGQPVQLRFHATRPAWQANYPGAKPQAWRWASFGDERSEREAFDIVVNWVHQMYRIALSKSRASSSLHM